MASRPTTRSARLSKASRPEGRFLRCPQRAGFALVAVIWSLGLIALLALALIMGARYRAKVSSSYASHAANELAAESAINLAIATVLAGPGEQKVEFPLRCRMPGGERAMIDVEEEAGKIDLNTATPAVLARLFTALTGDQSAGTRIAARVIEFRDLARTRPKPANAATTDPATPAFVTIMQLDQVSGMSAPLFRTALRFVTVRSGRAEPDPDAATPAMLRLLDKAPKRQPAAKRGLPLGGSVTVRADISGPDGTRFIREALVSLGVENGRPFVIREWRRGDIETPVAGETRDRSRGIASCFTPGGAPAS